MNRLSTFIINSILLLALTSVLVTPAAAQTPVPDAPTDDEVNAIARELYCPVCENIPLDVCGTQACADWRNEIRLKLAEGWDAEQIKDHFADRFGDRVLAEPPPRGLNWLIYIVPPLVFIAGVYILYHGMRSWRQMEPLVTADKAAPETDAQMDEYAARLEEELRSQ
ncbi:MAG: cytochrome c-type biogenesis protein [Chloroflexota bacterium]|nr:cytochrome c-type biogenesis protein [Chloroflexota bacterium]